MGWCVVLSQDIISFIRVEVLLRAGESNNFFFFFKFCANILCSGSSSAFYIPASC